MIAAVTVTRKRCVISGLEQIKPSAVPLMTEALEPTSSSLASLKARSSLAVTIATKVAATKPPRVTIYTHRDLMFRIRFWIK